MRNRFCNLSSRVHVTELDAYANQKITNISFMKSLKKLNMGGECGIIQNNIKGLEIIDLKI